MWSSRSVFARTLAAAAAPHERLETIVSFTDAGEWPTTEGKDTTPEFIKVDRNHLSRSPFDDFQRSPTEWLQLSRLADTPFGKDANQFAVVKGFTSRVESRLRGLRGAGQNGNDPHDLREPSGPPAVDEISRHDHANRSRRNGNQ
jgi:hypothetical protein